MKVSIDGTEISAAAILWLINYGKTVLNLSDEDFQLFQMAVKYKMTEEEMEILFKDRYRPISAGYVKTRKVKPT